jgi:hypothetical protein
MPPSQNVFPRASIQVVFSANFVAIVVAALSGWRLSDLVTLYWLELVALGGVTLIQMRFARAAGTFAKSRGYLVVLFVAHYGTFCVIYRAAIVYLFGGAASAEWYWLIVWAPLAALVIAHLLSFRRDYLPNEAAATSPFDAMWIPYLRELPVHVPLLIAILAAYGGSGTRNEVLLFGAGKTIVDFIAHAVYHTRVAPRRNSAHSM